jgi:hypothetical protein
MTTPTKASKPGPKPKTADVASFDFAKLSPKATETWQREGGREAKPIPENILAALRASKANDQAGLFSVPGAPYATVDGKESLTGIARELVNLLRRGAEQLHYGVKIKVDGNDDNTASHVAFQAVDRRTHNPDKPRKPTRRTDETDPEFSARMAAYERDIAAWNRNN